MKQEASRAFDNPVVPHPASVLSLKGPRNAARAPVLFDSPHSGNIYPADFGFSCSAYTLRQAEDTFVAELFEDVVQAGAVLQSAGFPRSYIDANRAEDDIDPSLIKGPWPGVVNTSEKGHLGMGLVRRLCKPGVPMYDSRLPVAVIEHRIRYYYRPYHRMLEAICERIVRDFGAIWHVNCHSMPSVGGFLAKMQGFNRADIVLGDRDGTTCDPSFRDLIYDALKSKGYNISINNPYKGVEIVRKMGQPHLGRNSIQLEINRALYMDEAKLEKTSGFQAVKQDMSDLAQVIAAYARDHLEAQAAD